MKEFKGKVALITGAANGFGKEFVKECAMREMKIAAIDIEGDEVEAVCKMAEEMGAEAIAIQADVARFEDVERAVNQVMETYGQIDLLMNNKGIQYLAVYGDLPVRDWEWIAYQRDEPMYIL